MEVEAAMSVAISATVQGVWPPRVQVAVTGLTVGDTVTLWRVVDGDRTLLRGGQVDAAADPSLVRVDAEAPINTSLTYVAAVDGIEYSSVPVTMSLPTGRVIVSDAITGLAADVVIVDWPSRDQMVSGSSFPLPGRTVTVLDPDGGWQSDGLVLRVDDAEQRTALRELMERRTSGVVQIRQTGSYDDVDAYVAVLGRSEARRPDLGPDPSRLIPLRVVEAEPWADALEARDWTLQDIADLYTGLTLADLAHDFEGWTLLTVALADWSA